MTLDALQEAAQLDALSVRQLKELLTRNRVEYRGCLERADLLTRARMLYQDHKHYRHGERPTVDNCITAQSLNSSAQRPISKSTSVTEAAVILNAESACIQHSTLRWSRFWRTLNSGLFPVFNPGLEQLLCFFIFFLFIY